TGRRGHAPVDRRRRRAGIDRGPPSARRRGPAVSADERSGEPRTPVVAANWKLHKTVEQAEEFIQALLPRVSSVQRTEVAICPTFTALQAMVDSTRGSRVSVYAQNMHQA